MKSFGSAVIFLLLAVPQVQAHKMDEPGPHQGIIKMPASFHTELVKKKNNMFQVYLLDQDLQNPSIAKSGVEFWFKAGAKEFEFKCEPQENEYFLCQTDAKVPAKGKVTLKTYREGIIANDAIYDILASEKTKPKSKTKKK